MKYNKQELKDSKEAYNDAKDLSYRINKSKQRMKNVIADIWLVNMVFCFFYIVFFRYGTGAEAGFWKTMFESFLIPCSPAILVSLVCSGVNKIRTSINKAQWQKAQLYIEYSNETDNMKKFYKRAIDKIITLSNSSDKQDKNAVKAIVDEAVKVGEKHQLSEEQMTEIEKTLITHTKQVTKDLPKAEREKLSKFFLEMGKIR